MKWNGWLLIGIIVLTAFEIQGEILTGIVSVTVGIGSIAYSGIGSIASLASGSYCYFKECCDSPYIELDHNYLVHSLASKVYGQHLATKILITAIRSHYYNPHPNKPLALSFHGGAGTGKNLISNIVINAIYSKKRDSSYVNFFRGRVSFPLESRVNEYKVNLQEWIQGNVSRCARSIFIFDEVEKMPSGLLEVVGPYIKANTPIRGIDFSKATFIFLSNLGWRNITSQYLELWEEGKNREEMTYQDFEDILRKIALDSTSGLYKTSMISEFDLSWFVPFLPLEEEHVKRCIISEFKIHDYHRYSDEDISEIMKNIVFYKEKFSRSGCKIISDRVGPYIVSKSKTRF